MLRTKEGSFNLKPANIKITPEGVVKILGAGAAAAAAVEYTNSPTLPGTHTITGAVLGTPGYMSPEQARGQVVARTDIWAFGCRNAHRPRSVQFGRHHRGRTWKRAGLERAERNTDPRPPADSVRLCR